MKSLQFAFHLVNNEWFRKPFSRLEYTLRFPFFVKTALFLFLTRILPQWLAVTLLYYFISQKLFLAILLGFIFALSHELLTLRDWYLQYIFPRYQANLNLVKAMYKDLQKGNRSPRELANKIELMTQKSAWGTIFIGYVGVAAWGWEVIFRLLYPLLVKEKTIPYYYLLIGLNNKAVEADQKLWEIAQVNDLGQQNKRLGQYLEDYGSRTEDIDLAFPTLRENKKAISSLLKIYRKMPSPQAKVAQAAEKQKASYQAVTKESRIPAKLWAALIKKVQENVVLREERRFYIFQADYYLRQLLLKLGGLLKINRRNLFNLSWGEIKKAAYEH